MKRIVCCLLLVCVVFSAAACGTSRPVLEAGTNSYTVREDDGEIETWLLKMSSEQLRQYQGQEIEYGGEPYRLSSVQGNSLQVVELEQDNDKKQKKKKKKKATPTKKSSSYNKQSSDSSSSSLTATSSTSSNSKSGKSTRR